MQNNKSLPQKTTCELILTCDNDLPTWELTVKYVNIKPLLICTPCKVALDAIQKKQNYNKYSFEPIKQ